MDISIMIMIMVTLKAAAAASSAASAASAWQQPGDLHQVVKYYKYSVELSHFVTITL